MRAKLLVRTIALFSFFLSCEDNPDPSGTVLDWRNLNLAEEWQQGSQNAIGINTDKLSAGINDLKKLTNFYSIATIYKGRLVSEEYKHGDSSTIYPIWSVTKSIMSSLVGIAIDKNIMADEFQSFESFYPNITDSLKGKITVAQLLTMSSGITDDISYMLQAYPLQYIINKNLLYPSGTYWNYSSAGMHVLSYLLTASTNESANSFAKTYLFPKLGITDYSWPDDAHGVSNGGFGLNMKLRDLAKFGQLYLQNGKSDGVEIISASWINKSSDMIIPFNVNKTDGYGYLWWIRKINGEKVHFAAGYGGQNIMIIPSRALVVAVTSRSQHSDTYIQTLNHILFQKIISSFSVVFQS